MIQIAKKIDFWIQNNQNVLFIGKHGTGKTSIVKEAFEKHNLKYRYFSASTMDPWVDFIGVPKETIDDKKTNEIKLIQQLAKIDVKIAEEWVVNNWKLSDESAKSIVHYSLNSKDSISYLELVKPYSFASGEVEALFFDEFNRSPKKVRNAVMELLQFKSINGTKFPNLRIIWGAINPEDENQTYDVEKLDPAQKDRFHVSLEIPYYPNVEWFRKEYGKRIADSAVQWWSELPEEEKEKVSPRRLQYALDFYKNKGDLRDILPSSSNVSKLHSVLTSGPTLEKLDELIKNKNEEEAKNFLGNENNYSSAIKYILKSDYLQEYFLPLLPKEKIAVLLSDNEKATSFIISNCNKVPVFKSVCEEIIKANTNTKLVKKLRKTFTEMQTIVDPTPEEEQGDISKIISPFYNPEAINLMCKENLKKAEDKVKDDPIESFKILEKSIPKIMSKKDALKFLDLLSKLNFKNVDLASSVIMKDSSIKNFIPIINHCIVEGLKNRSCNDFCSNNEELLDCLISNNKPISMNDFLKENVNVLYSLFTKIKLAGVFDSVLKTDSQVKKFCNE